MTSYARVEIALILILGGALTAVTMHFASWWALLPTVVALALLAFYRDPRRRIPAGTNLLLAPADGRVVEVVRDVPGASPAGRRLRITIFLSVFDVHVNRSPCAAHVRTVEYRAGRFLNALREAASRENECTTITLDPEPPLGGPVVVRQIAGVLARRIVCAIKPDDRLAAGQRFGMIKLGSRTEVSVPEDPRWCVQVAVGDRVYGGKSILARLDESGAVSTAVAAASS